MKVIAIETTRNHPAAIAVLNTGIPVLIYRRLDSWTSWVPGPGQPFDFNGELTQIDWIWPDIQSRIKKRLFIELEKEKLIDLLEDREGH